MNWMTQDWTTGQLNALVKNLGGDKIARGINDGTVKFVVQMSTTGGVTGSYELYRHKQQRTDSYIVGHDLETCLRKEKLEVFQTSLESELVKEWIAHPGTYPEELKRIYPCLWGSAQNRAGYRSVPFLVWGDSEVDVYWDWLDYDFSAKFPALLASSTGN